jgi:hypothetical protein
MGNVLGLKLGALSVNGQTLLSHPKSRLPPLLRHRLKLGNRWTYLRKGRQHCHVLNVGDVAYVVDGRRVRDVLYQSVLFNQGAWRPSQGAAESSFI